MGSILLKLLLFLLGAIVGGALVFGIGKIEKSGDSPTSSNTTGTRVNATLRHVIVISRHGNKGGSYNYPEDPYPISNTHYWPYGSGLLTPQGRVQSYNLGVKVRSLYNGFLPSILNASDVYASSDTVPRVILSGDLFLAGLYPPQGWQVWNYRVDYQPIALYLNSTDHSTGISSCEKSNEIKNEMVSLLLEEDAANISTLVNSVYQQTGSNLSANELADMFEKLTYEEAEGFALPKWTAAVYPEPLYDFYAKYYLASTGSTDEVVRLYVGDLSDELLSILMSKVNGSSPNCKISYYSGHDSTLLNLQLAFGVTRASAVTVVRPGSALIIELHQQSDTEDFTVQVLYVDGFSLSSAPLALNLPECGTPCYFPKFVNTTSKFTNVSYTQECQVSTVKFHKS